MEESLKLDEGTAYEIHNKKRKTPGPGLAWEQ
jgi:hypothetical protein